MKKVSKVSKFSKSDKEILRCLLQNIEGLRVPTISKLTTLSSKTIYRRLNILRDKKIIENIFPIWKIAHGRSDFCLKLIKSNNIFELHNISYVVKLLKKPDWWSKRKNYLIRLKEWQFKNINFGNANSNSYQQLMNENFVIQCYPESLIIIARKRYYSNNPYETIQNAMLDVLELLDWFCERFRFNFFVDGVPHLEVRNNDFNRMNDAIANQVKRQKGKFLVEIDKRRKVWVDMSEPFGKEANYPNGQEKLEKITKDYLTKEVLLPSELQGLVSQLTKVQMKDMVKREEYSGDIVKHKNAIVILSKGIKKLTKVIGGVLEENRIMKGKLQNQSSLGEFI